MEHPGTAPPRRPSLPDHGAPETAARPMVTWWGTRPTLANRRGRSARWRVARARTVEASRSADGAGGRAASPHPAGWPSSSPSHSGPSKVERPSDHRVVQLDLHHGATRDFPRTHQRRSRTTRERQTWQKLIARSEGGPGLHPDRGCIEIARGTEGGGWLLLHHDPPLGARPTGPGRGRVPRNPARTMRPRISDRPARAGRRRPWLQLPLNPPALASQPGS